MYQEELATEIKKAVQELYSVTLKEVKVERPALPEHGDYSTNVALLLAPQLKKSSMEVAESLAKRLAASSQQLEASFAKPGFINFTLTDPALGEGLQEILKKGKEFGKLNLGKGKKVNVEFVSANPTGPLHIGNFRGGPLGDTIAGVLEKAGFLVTREYYHNDLGEQVGKLGRSLLYWVEKLKGNETEFPEDGYQGEYVKELAKKLSYSSSEPAGGGGVEKQEEFSTSRVRSARTVGEDAASRLGTQAVQHYFEEALQLCEKTGIKFEVVSCESEIEKSGKTEEAIKILDKKGFLKEKEGATWFAKEDEFLGDRECVVKKSNGSYTYFANDLGYHVGKHERGFEWAIDVWGANHHGHVSRMKSGIEALGFGAHWLTVPLYQWVTVLRSGKPVSMSKRAGNFITAQEVLEEVGKDALRWFFLSRDLKTHVQFDLDLAREQSKKNPVYYAQYAHARICSVLQEANQSHSAPMIRITGATREERALIRELLCFPELVAELAQSLEVHKLTLYATSLADNFHKFYETCRVLGDAKEEQRLAILKATQIVLASTLSLLGISTPQKM
jgi:arginyl-tRNA synthetase